MLSHYRRVFSHPGAAAMSGTGIIARFPMSMMTLGIVILVSSVSGSYAAAGAVSAAYVIGNAVVAIPHGRLADRFGQRVVLLIDSLVFAVATGLLIGSVTHDWAAHWPYVWAALAGVSLPQIGALVRARWSAMLQEKREGNQLHTAFAIESIGDEVVFVSGPTLVTLLSTTFDPTTGLWVALALGTIGTLALAAQRSTEPPAHRSTSASGRGVMPWRRLLLITAAAAAVGSVFGAMEVATVAYAEDAGHPSWAGYVLTMLALGSLIAGVLAGAHTFKASYIVRARWGVLALVLPFTLIPFTSSLWLLGGLMFLAGLAVAPTIIAVMSFVEHVAPAARLTEAMGLVQTGLAAGIAPGTWTAGLLADAHGGPAAFWACVVSGVIAIGCALSTR